MLLKIDAIELTDRQCFSFYYLKMRLRNAAAATLEPGPRLVIKTAFPR